MAIQVIFTGQAYRNFIETIHSPDTRGAYNNSLQILGEHTRIHFHCISDIEAPILVSNYWKAILR